MNVLDVGLVLILGVSVVSGLRKGLIQMVFSLAGVLLGVLVALLFSPRLAPELDRWVNHPTAAYAAALILLFVGTLFLSLLVATLITKVVNLVQLGFLNRLLGGAFGLVIGAVIGIMVLLGLTLFLEPEAPLLARSRLTPRLAWSARALAPLVPEGPREVLLDRLERLPAEERGPEVI